MFDLGPQSGAAPTSGNSATSGIRGLGSLFGNNSGSTTTATSTVGIRGLGAEDIAKAQPNPAAVTQAESGIAVARESVTGAEIGLAARQADIASARAAVELAQIDLGNTVIRAPQAGKLGQIGVRAGQYVTPGTALVSLVGADVWVIANFRETQLRGMRVGDRASFTVDAMEGRRFTGRVEAFSPATASEFSLLAPSNATGNFTKVAQRLPVRISIDPGQDMAGYLEPGLSVVVTVDEGSAGQGAQAQTVMVGG